MAVVTSQIPASGVRVRIQPLLGSLVAFLVVVFVFEESLYGRLGLSGTGYLVAKALPELVLYCTLLLVLADRLVSGKLARYQPSIFDLFLTIFVGLAFLSLWINGGSIVEGALNLRTMLRYVSVFYIIALTGWRPTIEQFERLFRILVYLGLLQSGLILLQHLLGDAFRDAWFSAPRAEVEINGVQRLLGQMDTKLGAGFGTFGKTPLAAFFLLFVMTIVACRATMSSGRTARRGWLVYVVLLLGVYFTYKRAPLLIALIVPILAAWMSGRFVAVRRYLVAAMVIVPLAMVAIMQSAPDKYVREKEVRLSPAESLGQLFSDRYWSIASSKSRGWMIREVGAQALGSFRPLGYGPDEARAKRELSATGGEFSKLAGWGAFDDVYLVACLVYYGPIGVLLLLLAVLVVYRRARRLGRNGRSFYLRVAGTSLGVLTVIFLLSTLVVRLPEFRSFAFAYWALAGIVMVATSREGQRISDGGGQVIGGRSVV